MATKRTWCGIQFTFQDGRWVSPDGSFYLHCASGLRRPCSDHWSVWTGIRSWTAGMTPTEALESYLKMREEGRVQG